LRRGQKGAQLCFARAGFFPGFVPPFAEHLGDAARGHAAAEDGVDAVGAGPDVDGVLPHSHPFLCGDERTSLVFREELVSRLEHLVDLGIGEALDVDEGLLGDREERLDGGESRVLYFLVGREGTAGVERVLGNSSGGKGKPREGRVSAREGRTSARWERGDARDAAVKTYLEIGGGHAALLELVDEDEALRELFEGLVFYDLVALLDGLHDGARIFDGGGGHDRWGDETRERKRKGGRRTGRKIEDGVRRRWRRGEKCGSHSCGANITVLSAGSFRDSLLTRRVLNSYLDS
jgi:hypothetical protein